MNALRAARTLAIHPNTLYARMKKVREITGLDALGYRALTEILLVIEIGATQAGPANHD